ncbi:MAG: DDE-type integrase/transposase/recombinase [Acidobacteriia bacterium]|nr:DDE-type integrase/transposase/recombinase [Terriglobia bacterium]
MEADPSGRRFQCCRFPLPKRWRRCVRSAAVHAVSMANVVFAITRSHAENHFNARVRLHAENDRLRCEIALLREELRIKDHRMEQIPPQRRPHYPPTERLAVLELRAARGWSLAQTARRLLVTPLTVATWNRRLDEEGPHALVQVREPVNRFPDFVGYLVRRLRVLLPSMGTRRNARVLARAGLHLGATTVRRMLHPPDRQRPSAERVPPFRAVTSKRPDHVWHADLTTVPTSLGFWVSWMPLAFPQRWPFCWWVAVAVDHFSRRVAGVAVFKGPPTAAAVMKFLDRTLKKKGSTPRHLITDQGVQFLAAEFRAWCRRRGIAQRFGAIGKYGSLAVIERFIRTMKTECTRRLHVVPYRPAAIRRELALYVDWYNAERPHSRLAGRTPDEIYFGKFPISWRPRFEPRTRWPRRSPCAMPHALVRGRPGTVVELDVAYRAGRRHLPIISLKRAA